LTTYHLDIPTTHQDSIEWKPIATKSNTSQQKSRYEYPKPRSSRRNYKYKRDIDPNDTIADIYDSNTREQGNLLKGIDNKTFRRQIHIFSSQFLGNGSKLQ
jgi:hypothetical protein